MIIERVEHPGEEWDRYAVSHPTCGLGHAAAWSSILRRAYGLESIALAARSPAGQIVGLLPLSRFRSRPGARPELVSLPFLDWAGPLADDPAIAKALIAQAVAILAQEGLGGLELRERGVGPVPTEGGGEAPTRTESVGGSQSAPCPVSMDRVNLVLPLEGDAEVQWKGLSAKVRNQCRKAEREGLGLRTGDRAALLAGFLEPYCVNMRDLGSPPHSRAFFEALGDAFGARVRMIVTEHAGRAVGGLVALHFGPRVYVPWASTLRSERNRCPNNQIYWEAIRWAIDSGAAAFDFGRSPQDGGTYRFKKGWGAVEEELVWRRIDASGTSRPRSAAQSSALVARLSALWTRMPVPLATAVGSRLRRYFSN